MKSRNLLTVLPVLVFVALAALLLKGLSGDPSTLPSVLVGKPVPDFVLKSIAGTDLPGIQSGDLRQGRVTIVNVWASWCAPCRDEMPLLVELAKRSEISVIGINNKDDPANATRFLATLGNPFTAIGSDIDGRVSIDWGVYGVPETFIVDGKGIIRHRHVGPLTAADLAGLFNAEIEKAKTF